MLALWGAARNPSRDPAFFALLFSSPSTADLIVVLVELSSPEMVNLLVPMAQNYEAKPDLLALVIACRVSPDFRFCYSCSTAHAAHIILCGRIRIWQSWVLIQRNEKNTGDHSRTAVVYNLD